MSQDLFEKLAAEGPVNPDQLLEEDDILSEEDKKKPDTNAACGPSDGSRGQAKPKKACANCTCGLADERAKEARDKTQEGSAAAAKSSCGSCYLGDAFRCASCPYRGTPAFKPGEKVIIDTTQDDL